MTAPAAIGSDLEALLLLHIRAARLPEPTPQYRPIPGRRFRLDFAWPSVRCGVEVQGGTWIKGAHVQPGRYASDCVKSNECALRGWLLLRVTREQIEDGRALAWVERALAAVGRSLVIGEAVPA